ncbi:MAG: hypothetical protein OXJ64_06825 [Boseongicola sp.]|nr:hypothetical protein [Boseongicola sp.]
MTERIEATVRRKAGAATGAAGASAAVPLAGRGRRVCTGRGVLRMIARSS